MVKLPTVMLCPWKAKIQVRRVNIRKRLTVQQVHIQDKLYDFTNLRQRFRQDFASSLAKPFFILLKVCLNFGNALYFYLDS